MLLCPGALKWRLKKAGGLQAEIYNAKNNHLKCAI